MSRPVAWATLGAIGLGFALVTPLGHAQAGAGGYIPAPEYTSGASAGLMSDTNENTPEATARPGVKFFKLASRAYRQRDYAHAIDMFKVAASWADKPAEYDLGVMYFHGKGVPADRALGAAWMVLAAERGNADYVKTRNIMISALSDAEFSRTDALWRQLRKTYGDRVALRRAKAQWLFVRSQKTGSRTGGNAGELHLGVGSGPGSFIPSGSGLNGDAVAASLLPAGSVDGDVAYRQFRQSDNPYSPIFEKNQDGNVEVGPLVPVPESRNAARKPHAADSASSSLPRA